MLAQFTVSLSTAFVLCPWTGAHHRVPLGGGLHLQLICNLQNTVSYILEKYVTTLCMGQVP